MKELHGLVVSIRPDSGGKMVALFFFFCNSDFIFLPFKLLRVVGFCFVLLYSQKLTFKSGYTLCYMEPGT